MHLKLINGGCEERNITLTLPFSELISRGNVRSPIALYCFKNYRHKYRSGHLKFITLILPFVCG